MAKKSRKHRERTTRNYTRFYIVKAFDGDKNETEDRWEKLIIKDLAGKWIPRYIMSPTQLSRWDIVWHRNMNFKEGGVYIELGMYRDGFHVKVKTTPTAHLGDHLFKMQEYVFGDKNTNSGWTTAVEEVAPLANAIVKDIVDYFKSLE